MLNFKPKTLNSLSPKGIFCISLDFELNWGCFESKLLDDSGKLYFKNTRNSIPKMLGLFTEFNVEVTWAIVGMLYNRNEEEWRSNIPTLIPSYKNSKRSSYEWFNSQKITEQIGECLFAPNLVDLIQSTPGMEIGTHTYSHFYCKEEGQTIEAFKADLEKGIELARKKNIQITSLVFPRNQFNNDYLSVCNDLGINSVRSNPTTWYWDANKPESLFKKMFRTGDSWLPINRQSIVPHQQINSTKSPMLLPASRLYRPWTNNPLLNKLKMIRIKNEMTAAAKKKSYYHLWWHPHNFGNHPDKCLEELRNILQHYTYLNKKYGFTSLNMRSTEKYLKTP